ncbi:MAG: ABC transporter permease [Gammaproteobacteria bacterium]
MTTRDILQFAWKSLYGYRTRMILTLLAMSIGVAAVILLSALGEGARRYINNEFASLGTHLLIVIPGKSETSGGGASIMIGETTRDLTLEDTKSLTRSSRIKRVAPVSIGSSPVSWSGRYRETPILGSTSDLLELRHWSLGQGQFLPPGDMDLSSSVAVIGSKVRNELFGSQGALGEFIRIGDRRFRVIGVLSTEGRSIGLDVDELVVIPVASAQNLFNRSTLFRILVEARTRLDIPSVKQYILNTISKRHQGEEDITVITQDAVLSTFDRVFQALTLTVAGIAAISLIVSGILIMNVMLVSVSQRTAEIGLLKAIGASGKQILLLILSEATLLSVFGACVGISIGLSGTMLLAQLYPHFPVAAPFWSIAAAFSVAVLTGFIFAALPASKASKLDPVLALMKK